MRIRPVYSYNLFFSTNSNKTSVLNCTSFSGNDSFISELDDKSDSRYLENYLNISANGFNLYDVVDLINPKGAKFQGYSFIKEYPDSNSIVVLITDDNFNELGHASCSTCIGQVKYNGTWCSVVNSTDTNPESILNPIFNNLVRAPKDGHCKHVGTKAYDTLIDYIKKFSPEIKELNINATNQHSWDFHKKYGFDNPNQEEYDCYAFMNQLIYTIK